MSKVAVRRLILYTVLFVSILAIAVGSQVFAYTVVTYGDQNIEQWQGRIGGDLVQAYVMFWVNRPTVIQSISMFTQYSGSDGTQCFYFGIYKDNGSGSPAGQPLVASTSTGAYGSPYCLRGTGSWGPGWQTWRLRPSDYLVINGTGAYWLATLARYSYGNIYHYAYTGAYDFNYGYADYFFSALYSNGLPAIFNPNPSWEANAPYSIYLTGVTVA
jgi:hypothetical protein